MWPPVRAEKGDVVARRSARRTGVDPRDEPSAEWGWHGGFPNGTLIAGVVSAIALLLLLVGPYQTHLQVFWVLVVVVVILAGVAHQIVKRRKAWRR
jgi:lysylphosphatidylglycerol synthetase-like protein (DUF2156 family)